MMPVPLEISRRTALPQRGQSESGSSVMRWNCSKVPQVPHRYS